MRRNRVEDKEYLDWIRQQPCCICGYQPSGVDKYGNPKTNAAHHVDGRHNDHLVVPLCDWYKDQGALAKRGHCCHHGLVHRSMREWRPKLLIIAKDYRRAYDHREA